MCFVVSKTCQMKTENTTHSDTCNIQSCELVHQTFHYYDVLTWKKHHTDVVGYLSKVCEELSLFYVACLRHLERVKANSQTGQVVWDFWDERGMLEWI